MTPALRFLAALVAAVVVGLTVGGTATNFRHDSRLSAIEAETERQAVIIDVTHHEASEALAIMRRTLRLVEGLQP
jgi:hypothetical protein